MYREGSLDTVALVPAVPALVAGLSLSNLRVRTRAPAMSLNFAATGRDTQRPI